MKKLKADKNKLIPHTVQQQHITPPNSANGQLSKLAASLKVLSFLLKVEVLNATLLYKLQYVLDK